MTIVTHDETTKFTFQKLFSDWKYVAILALPIFMVAMWYGISNDYEAMGLYAIAMFLGAWSVAGWAVHLVRKWQEWLRFDPLTVQLSNKTLVSLDVRGLVRLEWPEEGRYLALGVEFADNGGEPHDGKFGPPPVDRPLRLRLDYWAMEYWGKAETVSKDVPKEERFKYLAQIIGGLRLMGYEVTEFTSLDSLDSTGMNKNTLLDREFSVKNK